MHSRTAITSATSTAVTATALLVGAALLALTGCSSDSSDHASGQASDHPAGHASDPTPDSKPSVTGSPVIESPATGPSATGSVDKDKARRAAGVPKDPTGENRTGYLAAVKAVDPWFVTAKGDEDAIDNGVNQCAGVHGSKAVWLAQQRFGTPDRPVTDAEAKKLNAAVKRYICP
ncbi:hypothetical protein [Streptomyces sp. DT171]|uniref:hypothetical protein n=1 Tax=Streptomyces sp. DT171 TaxID=3416524 RepID=UPI003CF6DECC